MKKKTISLSLTIFLSTLLFTSCKVSNNKSTISKSVVSTTTLTDETIEKTTIDTSKELTEDVETSEFNITTNDGTYTVDNGIYTITSAGTYTLSGTLTNGQILVSATDSDKITLELNNAKMEAKNASIIKCMTANKVIIKSLEGTTNEIGDYRDYNSTYDTIDEDAAIYCECDLNISGKGELNVISNYNNGIHTKDDLEIKNTKLNVTAINNCLKGNDYVTIESGDINLISLLGDGIKTSNSSISKKNKQKGTIEILDGTLIINAKYDAIDSAYDCIVGTSSTSPTINLYTDDYSSYSSSDDTTISKNQMYVRIPYRYVSDSIVYKAYFYNSETGEGEFYSLENKTQQFNYYIYQVSYNTKYDSICLYEFNSTDESSTTSYLAKTEGESINSSFDMYSVSKVSDSAISSSWSKYQSNSNNPFGDFNNNSTTKLAYSAKGIKTLNNVDVVNGNITIKSTDDSIHANYGESLENGNTSEGNVVIEGGTLELTSKDDAIHADMTLSILGGTIDVLTSYEGLEGSNIIIGSSDNEPNIKVYATDDGINASGTNTTALVSVISGYVDVNVALGDTDGIDSNGNYTQSGGFVVTRCPSSDSSGNMSPLDLDGTLSITGGTLIAFGTMAKTPSTSVLYKQFGSSGFSGGGMGPNRFNNATSTSYSFTKGTYTISDTSTLFSFTIDTTYTSCFIASDKLVKSTTYTISNGSTSYSWQQS